MGFIPGDQCSWKTKKLWIYFLLTYLYGTCQSASADNCSMTLTNSEGEITSPGYPGSYNKNLNCTYVIVGDWQTKSIIIHLVELALTTGCLYDWLIIDGGQKLCYDTTFHKTYAFSNRFIINFRSHHIMTTRGFKIRYSFGANDNCTSINLKTSGQISTPCYSCNCTNNNCTNTIMGSWRLQTLTLDFVSLNYTTRANCDLGWFTIDGGPRICTSTPFKTTYIFFGSMDIVTHCGDLSGDSCAGFVANYVVEDNCSMTFTASEGEITSSHYPGSIYKFLTCTYVIVGDGQNQSITIDLVDLDVAEAGQCGNGWLILDDGPKLCRSDTTFHKTYLFLDRFIIKFGCDYRNNRRGFKIHYSVGVEPQDTCTSTHLKTSGQISSPCYSCNCTYNNFTNTIIGSGKLQTLILDFVSLNFPTSSNCDLGWFSIDGGPKICTSTLFKSTYVFFGSIDIVTHGGGRTVNSVGFLVNYVVEDNCSMTLTASEGEITSPDYPGTLDNFFTCTFVIVSDGQNQLISIDRLQLFLPTGTICDLHWLIIDDGPRLCRSHTTFYKTYVFRDKFIIKFRASYRRPSYGLKMHYSVGVDAHDTCTSNHLTTSGQISTPCYSSNCTCNYFTNTIIGSGKLQTLTLDFVSLNFTTSSNCDLGWFTIDGGPKTCTSTPFKRTYAFFGSVDIVTHGGGRSVSSAGFLVNYVVKDNCSTTLTASKGEITIPGNSGTPYNLLTCTYVIVGDLQNRSIAIDLVELDLHISSDCIWDWLVINDGPKLCSQTTFHRTYVFRDRFIIKFRSDYRTPSRGFKMHYSVGVDAHDTCTSTHLKTSGQISTPCYACNCTYNNCTNTIIGSGKLQTLILDFVSLNFTTSTNCDLGWFTIDGGPRICTSTPFKTTYAFFGSADIVTHGGGRSVDSCGGFVVNYDVEDVDNTKLTYTTNSGQLIGPFFPGAISTSRVTSTYIIVGHVSQKRLILDITVRLHFSGCNYAKLTLNGTLDLCDTGRFNRTYFSQNNFTIEFLPYYAYSFLIHYEKEDLTKDNCTSTHLTTSGQISTPCYSCSCTNNAFTNTVIGNGKLQILTLDFVSLNFTTRANCDLGWFTIDGGPKICTSTPFKRTYAFFGSVDIVTKGGGRSVNSVGFVVNYVVEDNCSTTFTASEGEITSPGYPGIPYNYLTCTYVVVGDWQNQGIIIDLLQLDLTSGSDCPYDWLIIDDGPNLCYETTFHKTYVFQDKFIIKFRTDYRRASYGFKMHYSVGVDAHDTCTSIHLTASGQILRPCYSCDCTYNNCTNTIIGSGKLQILTLDFVSLNFTTSTDCDLGWFTIDGGPKICTSTPFKTTYAFLGSADIVTHGGGRSVDSCGGFVVDYVVEDVDNYKLPYTTNSGQLVGPLFPGASSSSGVTTTYIIVGHVPKQSLTLDITLSSNSWGCFYAKLTLNGTEDLCDAGRHSRTYFSQNNFTIEFRYYHDSSFLIHYEKEDITKGFSRYGCKMPDRAKYWKMWIHSWY